MRRASFVREKGARLRLATQRRANIDSPCGDLGYTPLMYPTGFSLPMEENPRRFPSATGVPHLPSPSIFPRLITEMQEPFVVGHRSPPPCRGDLTSFNSRRPLTRFRMELF